MKSSQLLYVGIKGAVVALDRTSGLQAWVTRLKGGDFVNVFVESGKVFATTKGEIFCLDAATGNGLWHNPLKGFGIGLATIATEDGGQNEALVTMAQKRRQDQEAAAAAAAGASAAVC